MLDAIKFTCYGLKMRALINKLYPESCFFLLLREHTARVMKTVRAINTGRSSIRPKKQSSHQRQKASTTNNGPESLVNQSDDSSGESGGTMADSRSGSSVQGKLPKTRTVQGITILYVDIT